MGRKGWGSLNGQTMSPGSGYGGYNSPDGGRFEGFEETTSGRSGYQQNKSSSKVSSSPGGNDSGAGGGWADWDDDKNDVTKTAATS